MSLSHSSIFIYGIIFKSVPIYIKCMKCIKPNSSQTLINDNTLKPKNAVLTETTQKKTEFAEVDLLH